MFRAVQITLLAGRLIERVKVAVEVKIRTGVVQAGPRSGRFSL